MKNTLRYNPPKEWLGRKGYNHQYFGLVYACDWLSTIFKNGEASLLEIGSYKGESTSIFASTGLFSKITCLEPFEGNEEALDILDDNWERVKKEFYTNTRHWDYINLIQEFSYNVVDIFPNKHFDMIYIDASHKYEDIKKDIDMYLPKCKYIIGGHDYQPEHPGVIRAVSETFDKVDLASNDGSWFKVLNFQYL